MGHDNVRTDKPWQVAKGPACRPVPDGRSDAGASCGWMLVDN